MAPRIFLLMAVCWLATATTDDLIQRRIQVDPVVPADSTVQSNSDETTADAEDDQRIPPDPPVHSGPLYPGLLVKDGVINPLDYMDTSAIEDESGKGLDKRIMVNQQSKLWPKCIIPFKFGDLTQSQIEAIIQAFQIFEKYTCFRFYEWYTTISEDFGLGHNSYLEFISNGGCSSLVGMTNNNKGQKVSCCGAGICVHELGHAFGVIHEQMNPLRDDYIRVNFDNIKSAFQSTYAKKATGSVTTFPWKYDLSSVMHYGLRAFGSGSGPTMTMRDPMTTYLVQRGDDTYYYFLRELVTLYNCKELKCPDDNRVCHYEGYLTFQDNKCSCRCIYGLDSDTDCTSLLKTEMFVPNGTIVTIKLTLHKYSHSPKVNSNLKAIAMYPNFDRHQRSGLTTASDSRLYSTDWPAVPFAMLKVKDVSCPVGSTEGSLTHYGLLSWTAERHDADGVVTETDTTMKFCTFTGSGRTGESFTFSPGQYCINRVNGYCPEGFTNGHVQYDDAEPPEIYGSLPDGNFEEDTRLEFCCRNDGNYRIPIELPLKQRFILWRTVKGSCQEVKDAVFLGEQYFGFKYPKKSSIAYVQEPIPLSFSGSTNNIWLYYCVYQPITKGDCGDIIELTDDSPEAVISSPNYPDSYYDFSECTWIVRSPVNTRVVLDFIDFDIPSDTVASSCDEDELEIRFTLPGQPGLRLCGNDYKLSTVSQTNILSLVLHSMGPVTSSRKFKAKVKMSVKDDELCYKSSDKGATYRGSVNFAQDMKICLPWREVSHCPHNVFQYSDFFDGLDENFCRTPGHGLRPFCYTAAEGCVPNYCDVCGVGSCVDIYDDCMEKFMDDNSYCLDNLHIGQDGTIGCAATCNMCGQRISERANTKACGTPAVPVDGSVDETLKNAYTVGESVNFRCIHHSSYSATHTCTTSGKWDGPVFACQGCPDGWLYRDGICYKFFPELTSAVEATQSCSSFNEGTLIVPNDINIVYEIMHPDKTTVWLGLDDTETEGTFLWKDGTPLDTAKLGASWKSGQPDDKNGQDCVEVNQSKKLSDQNCEIKRRAYICQSPVKVPTQCTDTRDDCATIMKDVPNMCSEHKVFADLVCRQTCEICTAPSKPCSNK